MKLDEKSMENRSAAARSNPARGLRHSQLSVWRCGHTSIESSGSFLRMIACISSTTAGSTRPLPISGWLVTTMVRKPLACKARIDSPAPGSRRKSSSRRGAYDLPLRTSARTMTPSRSRKTAALPGRKCVPARAVIRLPDAYGLLRGRLQRGRRCGEFLLTAMIPRENVVDPTERNDLALFHQRRLVAHVLDHGVGVA